MAGLKNLKKRRRVQVIVAAFIALFTATAVIGYALRGGINYYRSPAEIAATPPPENEVFKLGGLVLDGTRTPAKDGNFSFVVTDCIAEIPVDYVGTAAPPDLFREGAGTIVTGKLIGGRFAATQILAKHDESYQPKELTETLVQKGACNHPNG